MDESDLEVVQPRRQLTAAAAAAPVGPPALATPSSSGAPPPGPPIGPGAGGALGPPSMAGDDEDDQDDELDMELAGFVADAYADGFNAVGNLAFGIDVELPEARAQRRGQAAARLLKKYGMADTEIIIWASFAAGIAGDFAFLQREAKMQKLNPPDQADKADKAPPKPAKPKQLPDGPSLGASDEERATA